MRRDTGGRAGGLCAAAAGLTQARAAQPRPPLRTLDGEHATIIDTLLLWPGEVALLHSCLVRSSGASSSVANASTEPHRDRETGRDARGLCRALSVSCMDARSRLACGARREASCPDAPLPPGCLEFPLAFARASSAKRERAALDEPRGHPWPGPPGVARC